MSANEFEISLGDVTDMEATVYVRYRSATDATVSPTTPGSAGGSIAETAQSPTRPPAEPGADGQSSLQRVHLFGILRGPYCEGIRTLPADFAFRDLSPERTGEAVAVVTDPCMWSEEMPHLYYVDVEARRGTEVVAEYHDKIALRRLAPRRPVDFAPGTG